MGRSTKRAALTAASSRPAKKRKSAEASMAKMKQIVDDEDAFSEDEKEAVKLRFSNQTAVKKEVESDAEEEGDFDDHEIVPKDATPVVAPGFRLWKTNSRLASKGELSQVAKYDKKKEQYSHFLKVKYDEQFTLLPLIITQGPYKGRRVFMLEPTGGFRFMDFPPEIRNHIYSFLVEGDDSKVEMRTAKKTHEARRPVMGGREWNHEAKKWQDLPQLFSTLLRTNKQIFNEAAPILYGTNHFYFKGLGDLKIFVDRIGTMRKYMRHIHIASNGFQRTKSQVFKTLKDSIDLQTLSFHHDVVCQDRMPSYRHTTNILYFVHCLAPLIRSLHASRMVQKAQSDSGTDFNVLDIVKFDWKRCHKCQDTAPAFPEGNNACVNANRPAWFYARECGKICEDLEEHCNELQLMIRKRVAESAGIKDPATKALMPDPVKKSLAPVSAVDYVSESHYSGSDSDEY